MKNNLLLCPFCDGEPKIITITYQDKNGVLNKNCFYYVECSVCKAKSYRESKLNIALNNWNRRIESI
jgi:hypothetical protein